MTINADTGFIDSSGTAANTPQSIEFNVSKDVTVTYNVDTNQNQYTTISSHKYGDNLYGAGSESTLVFRDDSGTKVKGTAYTTSPISANATQEFGKPGAFVGTWEAI